MADSEDGPNATFWCLNTTGSRSSLFFGVYRQLAVAVAEATVLYLTVSFDCLSKSRDPNTTFKKSNLIYTL